VFKHNYDAIHETERKIQLKRLYTRKEDQVTAMAELVLENRELTQAMKALKKKAGKTNKSGISSNSGAYGGSSVLGPPRASTSAPEVQRKKRKFAAVRNTASTTSNTLADIPASCQADMLVLLQPKMQGVMLRSDELMGELKLDVKTQKALETEMVTAGFKNKKKALKVPTEKVMIGLNRLRRDMVTLIKLKAHLKTLQQHKKSRHI
jgi:hypothetical protein